MGINISDSVADNQSPQVSLYKRLISSMLGRNIAINFVGQSVPILVALFVIPVVIRSLGTDRYGVLQLVQTLIGYSSLFDLGLGRALTYAVAERLGNGRDDEVPVQVWTSLLIMLVMGLAGALAVILMSSWLVYDVLRMPKELQPETLYSIYLLAASIPFVISTAGLRGIMEAKQRFDLVNVVRVPASVLNIAGPLLVIPFSRSLFAVVAVLLVGRAVTWAVYLVLCFHIVPALRNRVTILRREEMRPLLSFGGWVTVSNIAGPLLLYLDRFVVANMISVTAVAYYITPADVVTVPLMIIPTAVLGVLFPAFGVAFGQSKARVTHLYHQSMKLVFVSMFPVVCAIVLLAKAGLTLWLNDEFALNGFRVAQILSVAVLVNGLGLVSSSLIQASGRPDLTAKLHVVELMLYVTYLWWLVNAHGVNGAAFAWLIRVTISAVVLAFLARQCVGNYQLHGNGPSGEQHEESVGERY